MTNGFKLPKDFVRFEEKVEDWEEAIIKSAEPLLENGYIEQSYLDAMIESVKEYGPYIVIAPNIAMPHARPETGSKKVGYSVMRLNEAVAFSEDEEHHVKLLIALSCVDANTHLEILQSLVMILSDQSKYERIMEAKDEIEIVEIFS